MWCSAAIFGLRWPHGPKKIKIKEMVFEDNQDLKSEPFYNLLPSFFSFACPHFTPSISHPVFQLLPLLLLGDTWTSSFAPCIVSPGLLVDALLTPDVTLRRTRTHLRWTSTHTHFKSDPLWGHCFVKIIKCFIQGPHLSYPTPRPVLHAALHWNSNTHLPLPFALTAELEITSTYAWSIYSSISTFQHQVRLCDNMTKKSHSSLDPGSAQMERLGLCDEIYRHHFYTALITEPVMNSAVWVNQGCSASI